MSTPVWLSNIFKPRSWFVNVLSATCQTPFKPLPMKSWRLYSRRRAAVQALVNVAYRIYSWCVYLDAVSGPVIPELTEQLREESLSCRPGEEARRAAGESGDPLGPVHRHHRSNPKPRPPADDQLRESFRSHCTRFGKLKMKHKVFLTDMKQPETHTHRTHTYTHH